jgi:23S rRNA (adenine1618-N6)-methyltransferase
MTVGTNMHPRNKHRNGYDFVRLLNHSPELEAFAVYNKAGETTIDFHDEQAVRALNKALLKSYYKINFWDIPPNYLCPPIPSRVNYIHYLADLFAEDNNKEIPRGRNIKLLDIGTGANLVYPITGQSEYGWHFTGVDIDPIAIKVAEQIGKFNKLAIRVKLQSNRQHVFRDVVEPQDMFHATLCNPPFHSSMEAAAKGTLRKWKNLGKGSERKLNFGGKNTELWCDGGEIQFIANMISESVEFAHQCIWFTSLVSKKDNLRPLYNLLKKAKVADVKTIQMHQGQKDSRFIAWSFIKPQQRIY